MMRAQKRQESERHIVSVNGQRSYWVVLDMRTLYSGLICACSIASTIASSAFLSAVLMSCLTMMGA